RTASRPAFHKQTTASKLCKRAIYVDASAGRAGKISSTDGVLKQRRGPESVIFKGINTRHIMRIRTAADNFPAGKRRELLYITHVKMPERARLGLNGGNDKRGGTSPPEQIDSRRGAANRTARASLACLMKECQ